MEEIIYCPLCCKKKFNECLLSSCSPCEEVIENGIIYNQIAVTSWCSCNKLRSTGACDGTGFVQNECDGDHLLTNTTCTGDGPTPVISVTLPDITYSTAFGDPTHTLPSQTYILEPDWDISAAFPTNITQPNNCFTQCDDRFGYRNATSCIFGYGGQHRRRNLIFPNEGISECNRGSFAYDSSFTQNCTNSTMFGTTELLSQFVLYFDFSNKVLSLQFGSFTYKGLFAELLYGWVFADANLIRIKCKGISTSIFSSAYIQGIGGNQFELLPNPAPISIDIIYP